MEKRAVLCYGDSNTWGFDPATKGRYARDIRWTRILQARLGDAYEVIEEGLNGRTTVHDDPLDPGRNGMTYLGPCLATHKPIDLVILMLGTNELKRRFSLAPSDIAKGVRLLGLEILKSDTGLQDQPPKLLLLAPPPLAKLSEFADMFFGGPEKSSLLANYYRQVAEELGCPFLDTAEHVRSSAIDGVHWEREQHQKLGDVVAAKVEGLFDA